MAGLLVQRKSPIHGIGIFTTQTIKKNTSFYQVPMDQIFHNPKPRCAYLGNHAWVSDEEVLNFVNHSCSPNAALRLQTKPVLIAIRDIKEGEEITVDYNLTELNGKKVPCNCHSKNCKHYFLRIE